MRAVLSRINLAILGVIAGLAVALSVADLFRLAPASSQYYPIITVLLLGALGLHLVTTTLTTESFENKVLDHLTNLRRDVKAADLRVFEDSVELENYLGKRLLEAKSGVCDLTWKNTISAGFSASSRQLAHGYMDKCIASASARIPYREIFIFSDERRVSKLRRRLAEGNDGYSCRYFPDTSSIPRLQFVIVDDAEVFFFASAPDSILCAVRGKDIARVFKSYFEALWASATRLKEGPAINRVEVDRVLRLFAENPSAS